jgi:hypothetical protein
MAARNMQRIEINIHEKELCVRLVIYKIIPRCTVNRTYSILPSVVSGSEVIRIVKFSAWVQFHNMAAASTRDASRCRDSSWNCRMLSALSTARKVGTPFTPAPRLPPCYPTTVESLYIYIHVFIFPHIFAPQTRKVLQHSVKQQVHSVFTDSWFLPSSRDTSTEFSEYQVGPVAAGATNGVHFKYVGSIALYIGPLLFIRSTYSSITSWNDTTGLILHQPS